MNTNPTFRKSDGLDGTGMFILVFLLAFFAMPINAQQKGAWKGKKCAVVLTYDDALHVHLNNTVPLLDLLGFKVTFYISGFFPSFRERLQDWIIVGKKGHELGNHTLFHPCEGSKPGREWVKTDYDLTKYTVQRMADEIAMTSTLLQSMDGKTTRTFAYPCGDMKAGDSSYVDIIRKDFPAARGVQSKMEEMSDIDLYNIGSYMISGQSGDELVALVRKAIDQHALLVFLFHGVGGEHNLNVNLNDHRTLLLFLKQHERDIWIAPMIDVAEFVKAQRESR